MVDVEDIDEEAFTAYMERLLYELGEPIAVANGFFYCPYIPVQIYLAKGVVDFESNSQS